MRTKKFNRIMNYTIGVILLVLWGSIFIIHGIIGAGAWALTKLFFAPLGVILVIINMISIIICLAKKKKVDQSAVSLVLSIFLAFPIFMLFNVIQIEYPASINKVSPSITVRWPLNERTIVAWGGDTAKSNKNYSSDFCRRVTTLF